jgi:hypothetical protein
MQSFPELLSELRRLCAERSTGFVLIRPSGVKLARITLEKGEIVFISFQERSGVEALPLLAAIGSGRLDFLPGLGGTAKIPLPPTDEILGRLAGLVSTETRAVGGLGAASSQPGSSVINARSRSILEATLADYIGPMASIVCQGDAVRNQSLETAIEALAREIPDPDSGRKFIKDVRAKLARPAQLR